MLRDEKSYYSLLRYDEVRSGFGKIRWLLVPSRAYKAGRRVQFQIYKRLQRKEEKLEKSVTRTRRTTMSIVSYIGID